MRDSRVSRAKRTGRPFIWGRDCDERERLAELPLRRHQYTPEEIEAMKDVKSRLDPQWLLGRGNLFGE